MHGRRAIGWRPWESCLALLILGLGLAPQSSAQFVEPDIEILNSLGAEVPGDGFGWVGERIGDLNDDGATEYIIGAPFSNAGGAVSGRAYVYSGAGGAEIHVITGDPFDTIGWSVTGGGDFNNDGTSDYAVGGPAAFGGGNGRVLMFSGADHSLLHDIAAPVRTLLGYDINIAGDVDGDGHDDLIAGAITDATAFPAAGQVLVISGKDGSTIWTQNGQGPVNLLGGAVSGLCDLNGDGFPEQVAGAFRAGNRGSGLAYVLNGADGAILRTLRPNGTAAGSFGQFFAHDAGDVDNDGVCDIYVGDFSDSRLGPFSGRGYVYSGAEDKRLRLFNAENSGDGMGMGRGAGDADGDGHADMLIGAYTNGDAAFQGGKVYIYSGNNGQERRTFTGTVALAQLGFDVATLGDVNGDDIGDHLITGNDVIHVVAGVELDANGDN